MGHIKEPKGVDFTVDPRPLTKAEQKAISDVIAHYKATGKKKRIAKAKKVSKIIEGTKKVVA